MPPTACRWWAAVPGTEIVFGEERPVRKGYRAYRNRAIVYTLIETGMRRAAVRNLNLDDVDFKRRSVSVEEKGGRTHTYKISGEGLAAIKDYINKERGGDNKKWKSPASVSLCSHQRTRQRPAERKGGQYGLERGL